MPIPMIVWTVPKNLMKKKLPARKYFFSSTKKGKIGDDSKISGSHISLKDYLTCEKIWDKFNMKNTGNYHDHYLKKDNLFVARSWPWISWWIAWITQWLSISSTKTCCF